MWHCKAGKKYIFLFTFKICYRILDDKLSPTEPGYYEDGKFGIRIENIVRIVKAETKHNFRDRGFLTFKTVTLVPIQTKLIDPTLLTEKEVRHLTQFFYCFVIISDGLFTLFFHAN